MRLRTEMMSVKARAISTGKYSKSGFREMRERLISYQQVNTPPTIRQACKADTPCIAVFPAEKKDIAPGKVRVRGCEEGSCCSG
jgi:hypothetical protein